MAGKGRHRRRVVRCSAPSGIAGPNGAALRCQMWHWMAIAMAMQETHHFYPFLSISRLFSWSDGGSGPWPSLSVLSFCQLIWCDKGNTHGFLACTSYSSNQPHAVLESIWPIICGYLWHIQTPFTPRASKGEQQCFISKLLVSPHGCRHVMITGVSTLTGLPPKWQCLNGNNWKQVIH